MLREYGILKRIVYCHGCNNQLSQVKYSKSKDCYAFVCYKRACSHYNYKKSIKRHSFFDNFSISLPDVLLIYYYFFTNKIQIELKRDFNISISTIKKCYHLLQQVIVKLYDNNEINISLGGEGIICQVDESMFHYKQKYHHGRVSNLNRWVFGIVDISFNPARYYLQVVANRDTNTLIPIINNICKAGTIIWSDEWRGYRAISQYFTHNTVNHRFNYINPENGTHTQHIESLWNKLKRRLKNMMGVGNGDLSILLKVWMWLDNIGNGNFRNLLDLLK